jgi:hypothetical protein
MKVAKRMWSLAIHQNDTKKIATLFPLFSSPLAKMSQIVSDTETMLLMLSKLANPPIRKMVVALNDMKLKLGTIPKNVLKPEVASTVYNLVSHLHSHVDTHTLALTLEQIHDVLGAVVNAGAHKFLKKNHLL